MCFGATANVLLDCGHGFCYYCIRKWYKRGADLKCEDVGNYSNDRHCQCPFEPIAKGRVVDPAAASTFTQLFIKEHWHVSERRPDFMSAFRDLDLDLEFECKPVSNSRAPEVRAAVRQLLPIRAAMPKYHQNVLPAYRSVRYYSSLFTYLELSDVDIKFRNVFALRVMQVEDQVFKVTGGFAPRTLEQCKGHDMALLVPKGKERVFTRLHYWAFVSLKWDIASLHYSGNELALVLKAGGMPAGLRLLRCTGCYQFISNSVRLMESHHFVCPNQSSFNDISAHCELLPLFERGHDQHDCCVSEL